MRRIKIATLVSFWMLLGGCVSTSVYVLQKEELIKVKAGETITSKYDGWLLSERAVNRVMDAKIKGVNLK